MNNNDFCNINLQRKVKEIFKTLTPKQEIINMGQETNAFKKFAPNNSKMPTAKDKITPITSLAFSSLTMIEDINTTIHME